VLQRRGKNGSSASSKQAVPGKVHKSGRIRESDTGTQASVLIDPVTKKKVGVERNPRLRNGGQFVKIDENYPKPRRITEYREDYVPGTPSTQHDDAASAASQDFRDQGDSYTDHSGIDGWAQSVAEQAGPRTPMTAPRGSAPRGSSSVSGSSQTGSDASTVRMGGSRSDAGTSRRSDRHSSTGGSSRFGGDFPQNSGDLPAITRHMRTLSVHSTDTATSGRRPDKFEYAGDSSSISGDPRKGDTIGTWDGNTFIVQPVNHADGHVVRYQPGGESAKRAKPASPANPARPASPARPANPEEAPVADIVSVQLRDGSVMRYSQSRLGPVSESAPMQYPS
jgi:hypothetical protein